LFSPIGLQETISTDSDGCKGEGTRCCAEIGIDGVAIITFFVDITNAISANRQATICTACSGCICIRVSAVTLFGGFDDVVAAQR
jgi:hypothetical protein